MGDFDRPVETLAQYAERLLTASGSDADRATSIAKRLDYEYHDHVFAIDRDETKAIFGDQRVVTESNELLLSEEIYRLVSRRVANRCRAR